MLALVMAQVAGFMHRVVHAPHAGSSAAHVHNWVHDLFAAHEDDSTCRLLDSASLDTAGFPVAPIPLAVPVCFDVALREGEALARRADLFEARAPPVPSFA